MKKPIVFTLFMVLGIFWGCSNSWTATPCTLEAISSVSLSIRNAKTGEPLDTATIIWSVDGGPSKMLTCKTGEFSAANGSFSDGCDSVALAFEVAGNFAIEVAADGFNGEQRSVTISEGACHVEGESMSIDLTRA
jgi:hypothetical protein